MEQYPALPTAATHKVVVNSRLALRDAPAYLQTSDSAQQDNHIKGEILKMLPNGTNLIVLDEAVGYKCEWAEVSVPGENFGNKKLFVSNKYIQKLSGTAPSALYVCGEDKCVGKPSALPIVEWTTKSPGEVMLDENSATYKVVVEMSDAEYVSTGGAEISNRLREATVLGTSMILKHCGKQSDTDYVTSLMDSYKTDESDSFVPFQFSKAVEYFVDTKPNTYLKVLVVLPYRYVPPLENAKGVVETASGEKTYSAWDAMEKVALRSSYNTNEMLADIETAAKLFDSYSKDVEMFTGGIVDFNMSTEGERLREVVKPLTDLIKDNGITHNPFEKDEKLEIGWDNTLTPVFVSLTKEDGSVVAMHSGMDKFADTPPIDSQRTQGYLWQLNLLRKRKKDDMPWTDFVTTFTQPSPPEISPSALNAIADISGSVATAKKAAQLLNDSPIKTLQQKLGEDKKLGNLDFKSSLYNDRKNAQDFVGSTMASCDGLQATLNKINTVDDAFSVVLDKVNIADLIKQCIDAISASLPIETPEVGQISGLTDGIPNVPSVPDTSLGSIPSAIGFGEIPEVGIDYNWAKPSLPSVVTNLNLADFAGTSVSTLGLSALSFSALGLDDMSIDELGIGSKSLDSLGLSDMTVQGLNIGDLDVGSLGLDFDSLNMAESSASELGYDSTQFAVVFPEFGNIEIGDVDFGDVTVGELGFDLSSLTIAELGVAEEDTLADLGLTLDDVGRRPRDVQHLRPVTADESATDISDVRISDLDIEEESVESLGIDLTNAKASKFKMPSLKMKDFNLNLSAIKLGSLNNNINFDGVTLSALQLDSHSMSELGINNMNLDELGLNTRSVKQLNIGAIDLESLNLGDLNVSALGLTQSEVASLGEVIKKLGVDGAVEQLDKQQPATEQPTETQSATTLSEQLQFSTELEAAKDKLKELATTQVASLNPFEQPIPKFPMSLAIELPDNLPTLDIMGSMSAAIEEALTSLLNELFVGMVKGVLQSMLDECGADTSDHTGKENLSDMLNDSIAAKDDALAAIMAGMGLLGVDADSGAGTAQTATASSIPPEKLSDMNGLLDDISLMFTPRELCSLINGRASTHTITLARRLISKKYPSFNLTSRSRVIDFFKALGSQIDPSICELIEQPIGGEAQAPILGDVLCPPSDMDKLRSDLLENKGDGITPEQIADQLKRARQRKVNAAKILADMVNNGPLSDDYSPPPIFCQKGAPNLANNAGNAGINNAPGMDKQGGLMDLSHPSIDFAMEKNADNLFTPLYIAFSNDVRTYPQAFVEEKVDEAKTIEVPLRVGGSDSEIINPMAVRHYGSESAAENAADASGNVYMPSTLRKTQPALYEALREMETNDALVFKEFSSTHIVFEELSEEQRTATGGDENVVFENGGFGIQLKLPEATNSALEELKDKMSDVSDSEVKEAFDTMMEKMNASTSTYSMYYVLPKLDQEEINDGSYDSMYLLAISETKGGQESLIYRQTIYNTSTDDVVKNALADEKYIGTDDTISLTTASQHKFARLVYDSWSSAGATTDALKLYDLATEDLFGEISRDVFAFISQRIANSPFFQSVEPSSTVSGDTKLSSSTPVIEFLDLDPEPTVSQQASGTDPHLLGLQEAKKCMLDNVKKAQCVDFTKPTDGSPAAEMSDLEQEIMNTHVKLIVKVYMIDYYMKSVFTNSVFSLPEKPDETYVSHLVSTILSDLKSYDEPNYMTDESGNVVQVSPHGSYEPDFIEQVIRMYQRPEEDTSDEAVGGEVTAQDAIRQQIESQYESVNKQMKATISSLMVDDLNQQFVNQYLKNMTISDYGQMAAKFFNEGSDDFLETLISQYDDIDSLISNATFLSDGAGDGDGYGTDWASWRNLSQTSTVGDSTDMRDVDYSNGHLYLENYYVLEDFVDEPSDWSSDMSETNIFSKRKYKFFDDTNPEYYKYFGVISDDTLQELRRDLPEGYSMVATSSTKGAVQSVKRGLRIMYLPPTTFDKKVVSWAWEGSDEPTVKTRFNKAWNLFSVREGDEFHEASKSVSLETAVKLKAYRVIEQVQSGEILDILFSGSVSEAVTGDSGQTQAAVTKVFEDDAWVGVWKATNPFPLIKKEWSVSQTELTRIDPSAIAAVSTAPTNTALIASDDYKVMTEYLFPISRMKSILGLYCFQSVSMTPEVANAMSETKDELRRIFFAINSKGDYKQKDPALDAIGGEAGLNKMMQNEFGVRDMPASPNSWNNNMPVSWGKSVKGVGFGSVAKATGDAVLKIFKKQVEKNDPNISLAHKLAIATKMANVNIPSMAWSFMVLPSNLFPGFPGPPISPLTIAYHSMGLGLWKRVKGQEDDEVAEQLKSLGFDPEGPTPDSCEETE